MADFLAVDFFAAPRDLLRVFVLEADAALPDDLEPPLLLPEDFFTVLRGADFFVGEEDLRTGVDFLLLDLGAAFFPALLAALLLPPEDFDFFAGTFAPLSRASDKPIAIACLREVTFFPLRPLLSFPSFISCMASFTFLPAPLEYFAIVFGF